MRWTVRTTISPNSASSTNSSGSTASAIRSSTGSSPIGVITILLPAANGPTCSIRSMSLFHAGHPGTSAHSRQISSGAALVSMLCSVAHMTDLLSPRVDDLCVDYIAHIKLGGSVTELGPEQHSDPGAERTPDARRGRGFVVGGDLRLLVALGGCCS